MARSGLRIPARSITRPRLGEVLDRIPHAGVCLVSAPAGSGKSVLIGEWTRQAPGRSYLRVVGAHNDPVVFAKAVTESIVRAVPVFDCGITELIPAGQPGLGHRFTMALGDELERVPCGLDIVLDDVHQLSNAAIWGDLGETLDQLPDDVRVVLGSRWDPPIGTGGLRLAGRLNEVRAEDLAFDAVEARALIELVSGRAVTEAQAETLVSRTDGWAAGLQLAAISLAGATDIDEFVDAFAGSNRLVADYLIHEVMAEVEPEVRQFLLRTSVLEWLTPELCDTVTGEKNGFKMLEVLIGRSLFIVADEFHPDRIRYHHLFADLLRYQLAADDSMDERRQRLVAAQWLLENGHRADGIDQLLAAGEPRRVAELISTSGQEWFEQEDEGALLRWMTAAESMDPDPPLSLQLNLLAAQVSANGTGRAIETYRRLRSRALEPGDAAAAAALYACLVFDVLPTTEVRIAATEALELLGAHPEACIVNVLGLGGRDTVETIAATMLAVAAVYEGNLDEGVDRYRALLDLPGANYRFWQPYVRGGLAFALALAGRLAEAEAVAHATIESAESSGVVHQYGLVFAHFALAHVAHDRCEPVAAADHLHESGIRVHRTGRATLVAFQQLLRVEQVAATSGTAAALAALDPSTRVAPSPPYVIARSLAQEVRFLVAAGRLHTARTLIPRHVDSDLAPHVVDLELAAGRVDAARSALDDWADTAINPRSSVERLLRAAALLVAEGKTAAAWIPLQEALDVAEPEGLRRPFLEQPAVLCLLHHEARRASRTFERSIVERARCLENRTTARNQLIDPLSDREREVLDYLPTRYTNIEIARALYISVNTLKSHLRHIYAKLGVTDRDGAVERAVAVGLL